MKAKLPFTYLFYPDDKVPYYYFSNGFNELASVSKDCSRRPVFVMKLCLLLLLIPSTLAFMLPLEFRNHMHDRIEEYAPGSYNHLLNLHGLNKNQENNLNVIELIKFLALLEEAQSSFAKGLVSEKQKVNYDPHDRWISTVRLF